MRLLLLALVACAAATDYRLAIEYTTDGEVRLDILNISFRTVDLQVTLLGCDYGYFAVPAGPSFGCAECECTAFEAARSEAFG